MGDNAFFYKGGYKFTEPIPEDLEHIKDIVKNKKVAFLMFGFLIL